MKQLKSAKHNNNRIFLLPVAHGIGQKSCCKTSVAVNSMRGTASLRHGEETPKTSLLRFEALDEFVLFYFRPTILNFSSWAGKWSRFNRLSGNNLKSVPGQGRIGYCARSLPGCSPTKCHSLVFAALVGIVGIVFSRIRAESQCQFGKCCRKI